MKNKHIFLILFFLTFLIPPFICSAQSGEADAESRAKELRTHLSDLSSLSFTFTQRTTGQLSGRAKQASGQAFLVRNKNSAKMRWNYLAPDQQVIISDGKTLTMYFEKLNQMIISPADVLQEDITYSFFAGDSDITDKFHISKGIDEQDITTQTAISHDVLKLTPKVSTSQITTITLWITDNNHIKRIEIRDSFDTLTLLTLSSIKENSLQNDTEVLSGDLFTFSPPEGTEIIHQ